MSRVSQKRASRGSQKWIQMLVNQAPQLLDRAVARHLNLSPTDRIVWLSPLAEDAYAEYRDEMFLSKIDARAEVAPLSGFWPTRGPQWDALGRTSRGELLLIEAKAHIPELLSPPTQATGRSLRTIRASLDRVKRAVGSRAAADWSGPYYQYTNRLAHLYFFRNLNRIPAYLVFVYLLNDADKQGAKTAEEWAGAIRLMHAQLGIDEARLSTAFGGAVIDVFVDVADIAAATTT
jgi:hypothetical protein